MIAKPPHFYASNSRRAFAQTLGSAFDTELWFAYPSSFAISPWV